MNETVALEPADVLTPLDMLSVLVMEVISIMKEYFLKDKRCIKINVGVLMTHGVRELKEL